MKSKIIRRTFAAGLAVICAVVYSPAEIEDVQVFSGSSVLASAEDEVSYMIWNESTQKLVDAACMYYEIVSSETNVFKNGKWYLVNGETEVINRISAEGTAHLILADGANLNAASGITVEADSSLFIYGQTNGTGELTTTCTNYNNIAGIGSKNGGKCGSVTINGGIITVSGGMNAAGIGGGSGESGGEVSITGGIVEVRAKGNNIKYGSGIGAGYSSNDQGSLELSEDAIVKASSKSGNNDYLKDLPLIDRASYLNDHSYRYVRIEMKNQRLKTGL